MQWTRSRIMRSDSGIALISAVMIVAVLVGLSATVALVATDNLRNAGNDRLSASALESAEGGIAQAVAYIKANGLGKLKCSESVGTTNPSACSGYVAWANPVSPQQVTVGKQSYQVWIGMVSPATPPSQKAAQLRIHSTGTAGNAPGQRVTSLDIWAKPLQFPIGVYTDTATGGGSAGIHSESLFSQACVNQRVKDGSGGGGVQFSGEDLYYQIPAAAHSTQYVTTSNNGCTSSDGGNIHWKKTGNGNGSSGATVSCSPDFPFDQDSQGGPLTSGDGCYGTSPYGGGYPTSSLFDLNTLKQFDYRPGGLSNSEYAALRAIAQAEGTYYTTTKSGSYFPDPNTYPQGVLYFDLKAGDKQTIQGSDVPAGYSRSLSSNPDCGINNVVIIVRNGDLQVNSNVQVVSDIFVPEGTYHGQGGAQIIGTLFAHAVDKLTGTQDFYLDQCFLNNLPGMLTNVEAIRYHEVDR